MVLLQYEPREELPGPQPVFVAIVPVLCVAGALCVGAATNAVNGLVSLFYFQTIVGWMYGTMTLSDVVWQGLLESSVFGVVFAISMTTIFIVSTRTRLPLPRILRLISFGLAIAVGCWIVGGIIGLAWAIADEQSFRGVFQRVPTSCPSVPRWGWVGGSIWGVKSGGFAAIVVCSIMMHLSWRRYVAAAANRVSVNSPHEATQ